MSKKIKLLGCALSLLSLALQAQDSVYYYSESGEKIYLQKDNNVKFICFANEPDASCLNYDLYDSSENYDFFSYSTVARRASTTKLII